MEAKSLRSSPPAAASSLSEKMSFEQEVETGTQNHQPLTVTQQVSLNNKVGRARRLPFKEVPATKLKRAKKD